MKTLEQITLDVAKELDCGILDGDNHEELFKFAHRLVAALGAQGHIGYVEGLFDEDVIEAHGYRRDMKVYAAPTPPTVPEGWQPIETAPKNNKRPLLIARFNGDGTIQSFDYNGIWLSESESWEIPQVYWYWASANGYVEEPTHWMYEPEGFSLLAAAPEYGK